MAIPELLAEHIDFLRSEGYEINVQVDQEICIVLKDYAIPADIWSSDKVDLLVIAHPSYPNPKMDMFWVDPAITLQNKNVPQAVSSVSKCGRTWQQFSWHVTTWNPAKDNLITYLDVINDRLQRNQ